MTVARRRSPRILDLEFLPTSPCSGFTMPTGFGLTVAHDGIGCRDRQQ
jgi:hypothetical protein